MITTPYDFIAGQFHALRSGFRPKETGYLSLLLDPLKPGASVLDLGCGTGQPIATHIASLGHRVTGVDGSAAMLDIARERLPAHRWIHALMQDVEFDEAFDAVVCWDSLFHLPRRFYAPVIGKIHRWLAPGGRLMVSSGGLVDDTPDGFTDTMFDHEFYYDSLSPVEMTAALEHAGFRIVLAEMCDLPDGGRGRGKWATVAEKI
ncbi:MAG: class I SAM-dependent methyltransferase [Verrucomicrobiota bacterium]